MRFSAIPIAILLAGIPYRLFLLWRYPDLWFCSDEANLGIMAIRLLRDGTLKIFIAGEAYGGMLGVAVTALFSVFVGPFWGLKLTSLLFYVLFAASLYALAFVVAGRKTALVALTLVSISPSFLASVGVRLKGPHGEVLFLGTLLFLVTCLLTSEKYHSRWAWGSWGLLGGFSWYTYYLAVVFLVPAAIFVAADFLLAGRIRRLMGFLPYMALGFVVGSFPYWLFVFRHHWLPPFQGQPEMASDFLSGLHNFFLVGLPVIAGGRWPFSESDLVPLLSKLSFALYLGASVLFISTSVRELKHGLSGKHLITLQLLLYPLIFAASGFSWFAVEPRYLIGLYAGLPVVMGWTILQVARKWRPILIPTLACLLAPSVWGTLSLPAPNFNTTFDEPTKPLIDFMKTHKLDHFYANYWITYRLMFEAVDDPSKPFPLLGATHFTSVEPRYEDFESAVRSYPSPCFITWENEDADFRRQLDETGSTFSREQIGRFAVYYQIQGPRVAELR